MTNTTLQFSPEGNSTNSTYSNLGAVLNFTLPSGLSASPMDANQFVMGSQSGSVIQAILGNSDGEDPGWFDCESDLSWGCRGYGASQCSLDLCIKIYNASIENGKLLEHEMYSDVDSWSPNDSNFTSEYRSTIDISYLTDTETKTLQDAGYQWNDTNKVVDVQGILPCWIKCFGTNG
jgi:hypothetical protein